MDDLERKLKALPLAQPPVDLEQMIFGSSVPAPRRMGIRDLLARPVRLGWTLGLASLMLTLGFLIARMAHPSTGMDENTTAVEREVVVRIIEARSEQNQFDFTSNTGKGASGFLSGKLTLEAKGEGAI